MGILIICAFCGRTSQGNYGIHRDGFGVGPEVDLCDGCGSGAEPSCRKIWDLIAVPAPDEFAYRRTPGSTPSEAKPARLGRRRQFA
jgi:hypothetical protein